MIVRQIAATYEKTHTKTPIRRAAPSPLLKNAGGTTQPHTTFPNLEKLILIANANANSFPLNHFVTIAD